MRELADTEPHTNVTALRRAAQPPVRDVTERLKQDPRYPEMERLFGVQAANHLVETVGRSAFSEDYQRGANVRLDASREAQVKTSIHQAVEAAAFGKNLSATEINHIAENLYGNLNAISRTAISLGSSVQGQLTGLQSQVDAQASQSRQQQAYNGFFSMVDTSMAHRGGAVGGSEGRGERSSSERFAAFRSQDEARIASAQREYVGLGVQKYDAVALSNAGVDRDTFKMYREQGFATHQIVAGAKAANDFQFTDKQDSKDAADVFTRYPAVRNAATDIRKVMNDASLSSEEKKKRITQIRSSLPPDQQSKLDGVLQSYINDQEKKGKPVDPQVKEEFSKAKEFVEKNKDNLNGLAKDLGHEKNDKKKAEIAKIVASYNANPEDPKAKAAYENLRQQAEKKPAAKKAFQKMDEDLKKQKEAVKKQEDEIKNHRQEKNAMNKASSEVISKKNNDLASLDDDPSPAKPSNKKEEKKPPPHIAGATLKT